MSDTSPQSASAAVMTDPPIPVTTLPSSSGASPAPPPIPDPTKPYEAPQLPTLPPLTPPAQRDPSTMQQSPGPKLIPGAKGTTAASIAFGLDSILKGFMRGRDLAEQRKYAQATRLMNGLQYNYQVAASNYINLLKNGADPNSQEVQQAKAARDAAWTAMMKMYGNYINPQTGKGKGKKSKSDGGGGGGDRQPWDESNPLQQIGSGDPREKAQGIYSLGVRLGPPDEYLARQYSDDYRKQLIAQRNKLGDEQRFDELERKERQGALTDAEKRELEIAKEQRYQSAGKVDKKVDTFTGGDGKRHYVWEKPDGTRYETTGEADVRPLASQGAGTLQDFIQRTAKEAGIDVKDISAQSMLDLERAWKTGGTPVRTSQRQYVYTDKETGDIHVVPLTTASGAGAAKVPSISPSPSASSTGGEGKTTPKEGGGHGTAAPKAPPESHSATTHSGVPGDRVIGHTLSQPHAKSQQVVADTYKKQKPLFGLLPAQEDYMKEVRSDETKATPRQDLALIVAAVRSMNPGSVRLPSKELELELKAGSYGDRFQRWYSTASEGVLPADQREDLFRIVERETTKAGESIAADWKQWMSGQPLPEDLKRFDKSGSGGGDGSKITVKIPGTDKSYQFDTQDAADKFKRDAGIQ